MSILVYWSILCVGACGLKRAKCSRQQQLRKKNWQLENDKMIIKYEMQCNEPQINLHYL